MGNTEIKNDDYYKTELDEKCNNLTTLLLELKTKGYSFKIDIVYKNGDSDTVSTIKDRITLKPKSLEYIEKRTIL